MVDKPISMLSPAKVNLMLRVLCRRPDGYHELQTCFKILNWGDEMTFNFSPEIEATNVTISGFPGLQVTDNLIYKAAQLLKPWVSTPCNVDIDVLKRIPQGGGLGGGSSNAATTLKVLNDKWGCKLSQKELMVQALKLGADVPVFINSSDAIATGVGEILEDIILPKQYVLLLFPKCKVPTESVFKDSELNRNQVAVHREEAKKSKFWVNDCLPVVLKKYSEIKRVFDALSIHYTVFLSGTGSTLFMVFDDSEAAEKAKKMAQTICSCHLIYC